MPNEITEFLSKYNDDVIDTALKLRNILFNNLPGVIEQLDIPAKMIAYCYGQKYGDMICAVIPSKKGIKLSFYKGVYLPDPENLLEGTGKISRYVQIKSSALNSSAIKELIKSAFVAYTQRTSTGK